ncbi:unnamed protein product [Coffea canephora]|uniref:DH200=94 genomic scaffold, scaffold_4137 n=1 Tax=Coffea canephora TaxID=49390 RepID=A0A068VLG0_COFCA|nr:unnamed protein product [Coffea canephora]
MWFGNDSTQLTRSTGELVQVCLSHNLFRKQSTCFLDKEHQRSRVVLMRMSGGRSYFHLSVRF